MNAPAPVWLLSVALLILIAQFAPSIRPLPLTNQNGPAMLMAAPVIGILSM